MRSPMLNRSIILAAMLLVALPARAEPAGFWCAHLSRDQGSVCAKGRDVCEIATRLRTITECRHHETVWSTHFTMGKETRDRFYAERAHCEVMRELMRGTPCKLTR